MHRAAPQIKNRFVKVFGDLWKNQIVTPAGKGEFCDKAYQLFGTSLFEARFYDSWKRQIMDRTQTTTMARQTRDMIWQPQQWASDNSSMRFEIVGDSDLIIH